MCVKLDGSLLCKVPAQHRLYGPRGSPGVCPSYESMSKDFCEFRPVPATDRPVGSRTRPGSPWITDACGGGRTQATLDSGHAPAGVKIGENVRLVLCRKACPFRRGMWRF